MSTFTKEQLIQKLQHRISVASGFPGSEKAQMDLELARIALASLEAEPVAWTTGRYSQNIGYKFGEKEPDEAPCIMSIYWDFDTFRAHTDCDATALRWLEEAIKNTGAKPLYTAPPAPVSVPEPIKRNDADGWWMYKGRRVGSGCAEWYNRALDDCRAAMFQSFGNSEQLEPVTTAYKLPANTPCKDAPEHIWLQTAGIWPENGEFSELTWCSDNQHPDDTLYVRADVVTGNSPVIPDGWVMVPIEPTEDMIVNGFESEPDESFSDAEVWEAYDAMSGCQQAAHRAKLCWSAMISAAPKPDVR